VHSIKCLFNLFRARKIPVQEKQKKKRGGKKDAEKTDTEKDEATEGAGTPKVRTFRILFNAKKG